MGSLGILAGIIFIGVSLVIGYLLGGSGAGIGTVMGLGTAQRNISAALVVAAQNFGSDVVTYLMVLAVIGLIILMPAGGELGKRAANTEESYDRKGEQPWWSTFAHREKALVYGHAGGLSLTSGAARVIVTPVALSPRRREVALMWTLRPRPLLEAGL